MHVLISNYKICFAAYADKTPSIPLDPFKMYFITKMIFSVA